MDLRDIILGLFPFLKVSNYVIGFTDIDIELTTRLGLCDSRYKLTRSDKECIYNKEFTLTKYRDDIANVLIDQDCIDLVNANMNNSYGLDNPSATVNVKLTYTYPSWNDLNAVKTETAIGFVGGAAAGNIVTKVVIYNDDNSVSNVYTGTDISSVGVSDGDDFDFDITGITLYDDSTYSTRVGWRYTVVWERTSPVPFDTDLLALFLA